MIRFFSRNIAFKGLVFFAIVALARANSESSDDAGFDSDFDFDQEPPNYHHTGSTLPAIDFDSMLAQVFKTSVQQVQTGYLLLHQMGGGLLEEIDQKIGTKINLQPIPSIPDYSPQQKEDEAARNALGDINKTNVQVQGLLNEICTGILNRMHTSGTLKNCESGLVGLKNELLQNSQGGFAVLVNTFSLGHMSTSETLRAVEYLTDLHVHVSEKLFIGVSDKQSDGSINYSSKRSRDDIVDGGRGNRNHANTIPAPFDGSNGLIAPPESFEDEQFDPNWGSHPYFTSDMPGDFNPYGQHPSMDSNPNQPGLDSNWNQFLPSQSMQNHEMGNPAAIGGQQQPQQQNWGNQYSESANTQLHQPDYTQWSLRANNPLQGMDMQTPDQCTSGNFYLPEGMFPQEASQPVSGIPGGVQYQGDLNTVGNMITFLNSLDADQQWDKFAELNPDLKQLLTNCGYRLPATSWSNHLN
ncbi:hypothetical protein IWQ62_005041 [Dispira parvispora]|uniref:Uncharacterized protein n=1 Tax=Dispira parvispora TaxID=1520584 RepID=A0A9W8AKH3_9FUNG|nr:hypothetical protein IWQ62_005041 [Dispira parvispora]